jgi:putative nucleotidyltransferase with HDIG domain
LAIITFTEVKDHFDQQMRQKMADETKLYSLIFYEQLIRLEGELDFLASNYRRIGPEPFAHQPSTAFYEQLKGHFKNIAVIGPQGITQIIGEIQWHRGFSSAEENHLESGKALLLTDPSPSGLWTIYMATMIDSKKPKKGIMLCDIDQAFLWRLQGMNSISRSYDGTLCVLNEEQKVIHSDHPVSSAFIDQTIMEAERSSKGWFSWKEGRETYLTTYWSIPLKYRFLHSFWIVSQRVPHKNLYGPVLFFMKIFIFVFFLALLIVLFLSVTQIRRTMHPLEKLREGTRRIGEGDFSQKIDFKSGDEFEKLADSFNRMSTRLGKQFTALKTMTEIGETILSNLDMDKIARTVVKCIPDILQCNFIAFTHLPNNGETRAVSYVQGEEGQRVKIINHNGVFRRDFEGNLKGRGMVYLGRGDPKPAYLESCGKVAPARLILLPFFREGILSDMIAIGLGDSHCQSLEESHQLLQIAKQVKVALENAGLIKKLDDLNLGTLTALARAVDAKSPWTAGHSERVTQVAMKIGHAMNLSKEKLSILNRGALLHDIGKIGVPAKILDKPASLTDKEFSLIKKHPMKGFRIIEPIEAYKDVLSIILQHHERIDGKGYPQGLRGEDISIEAKIVAVADTFDAIISDRPYRKGLSQAQAMEIMREEAGLQFDPKVLEVFFEFQNLEESSSLRANVNRNVGLNGISKERTFPAAGP